MSVNRLFWRKRAKTLNYILILTLISISFIAVYLIKDFYKYQIANGPGKLVENRSFQVFTTNIEAIKELSYVESVLPKYQNQYGSISGNSVSIYFDESLKNNEVYISKNKNLPLNLLNLNLANNNYPLTPKGITDQVGADIYISKSLFETIFKDNVFEYTILLDNYYSKAEFENYLNENDLSGFPADSTRLEDIRILEKNAKTITIIVVAVTIIAIILIFCTLLNIINSETQDIALLKVIGYKNINLLSFIFHTLLLHFIFSFVFLFLLILLVKFISSLFNNLVFNFLQAAFFSSYLLYEIIIIAIITLILLIYSFIRFHRMNCIEVLEMD
ncbi:MAG: hypothetical protein K2J20_03610 [Bacilli bacterium]|nr:hypothetical protein [Bacilli bacterium]